MSDVQAELKTLLTFLTRDAKVPLALSIAKCKLLRENGLHTPAAIAKADSAALGSIFDDDKVVKQVISAGKRLSNPKKRALSIDSQAQVKRAKVEGDMETHLKLPRSDLPIDEVSSFAIETNRAPLFLAFALVVSAYRFSDQPLSSRLSLAQGVTSAGAQSKAKFIGLTDSTAEDDGWSEGQPKATLMGREIAVMRRHIAVAIKADPDGSQETAESVTAMREAFWSIDLEALKRSNGPSVAGKLNTGSSLPIHKPEAARAYLLKSIDLTHNHAGQEDEASVKIEESSSTKQKKMSAIERTARREKAVGLLLRAIEHVCDSWTKTLSQDDLDRKANSWYMRVRPYVQDGQAGWGQRGRVELKDIVALARNPSS